MRLSLYHVDVPIHGLGSLDGDSPVLITMSVAAQ
jgi:hypothetical protein